MINVEVKVFVNYLAEFRKKRGLTQVALAETVNIGVKTHHHRKLSFGEVLLLKMYVLII